MKKVIVLVMGTLIVMGCEETGPLPGDVPAAKNPGQARNQLQAQGCTATKYRGRLSITCADGSSASFGNSAYHIKDGGGVEWTNLLFIMNFGATAPTVIN